MSESIPAASPLPHDLDPLPGHKDDSIIVLNQDELRKQRCCCFIPPHMEMRVAAASAGLDANAHGSLLGAEFYLLLDAESDSLRASNQMRELRGIHTYSIMQGVGFAALNLTGSKTAIVSVVSAQNGNNSDGLPPVLTDKAKVVDTKDTAAIEAFSGAADSLTFWDQLFKRNSIDDLGLDLKSTVHFMSKYCNAFWNGSRMVYGDGDNSVFNSFTSDIDVIGHELAHGVTEYTLGLEYHNQAGALNESLSDVFGSLFKQWKDKTPADKADWLIGGKLIRPIGDRTFALRSMKSPGTAYVNHPVLGTDQQPGHMSQYKNLPDTQAGDWGGVHINSGIPNKAFYLVATTLGGFAWEKAGRIWYEVMKQKAVTAKSTFVEFARATVNKASTLFGSKEQKIVQDAWVQVGVLTSNTLTELSTDPQGANPSLLNSQPDSPKWIGRVDYSTSSDEVPPAGPSNNSLQHFEASSSCSSIIPHHIQLAIARSAPTQEQREAAETNLVQDNLLRQQREEHGRAH